MRKSSGGSDRSKGMGGAKAAYETGISDHTDLHGRRVGAALHCMSLEE